MKSFVKVGAVCIFSLLLVFTFTAQALADWPGKKPISVVISYKAGGGTDTMTRAYTSAMEDYIGTTINAMNRPGAVGALAMDFVASKPSNGYWWQGASNFNKSLRVMGLTKLSWRDWQYFKAANSTQSFAVRPDSPFKTLDDFIAAAKKDPGKYKINGSGVGGLWSEGVALLENAAGIKLNTVHYKGGKPGVLATLQGEIDVCASGLHEEIGFIQSGKLRPLATFAKDPITLPSGMVLKPVGDFLPSLKAFAPFGGYYTLAVKKDTPVPILKKIAEAFAKACNSPGFTSILKKKFFTKDVLVAGAADKAAAKAEATTSWLLWDLKVEGVKVNPADLGIPRPADFEKYWPPKGYKPRF